MDSVLGDIMRNEDGGGDSSDEYDSDQEQGELKIARMICRCHRLSLILCSHATHTMHLALFAGIYHMASEQAEHVTTYL